MKDFNNYNKNIYMINVFFLLYFKILDFLILLFNNNFAINFLLAIESEYKYSFS